MEEQVRVYYSHDAGCDGESFHETNGWGLKTCIQCAGIFDAEGNGVCITDKRFDTEPPNNNVG